MSTQTPDKIANPPQQQDHKPGYQTEMRPKPVTVPPEYQPSGKLKNKVALITGGDSGIGQAIAQLFALEGAKVAITYLNEDQDAQNTQAAIEAEGGQCVLMSGNIRSKATCQQWVDQCVDHYGQLDIVINNAAEHWEQSSLADISEDQLRTTFETNVFSLFYLTQAALPHLKEGSTIINTASITAYKGNPELLDYSATKGAVVAFTRALSNNLISKGIRVNAVAPGPIWTPLIPASFSPQDVAAFGTDTPMARPGQPWEVATCFLFLASQDSQYLSGQVMHPNGGQVVGG